MFTMVAPVKFGRIVAWTMTALSVAPFCWACAKPSVAVHQLLTGSPAQALSGAVKVPNAASATNQVPSQAPVGAFTLAASQGSAKQNLTIFSTGGKSDYPVIALPTDQVCSGTKYYDATGVLTAGTKACAASQTSTATSTTTASTPPLCTADGVVGCVTTTAFKSADVSQAIAGNIISGKTIAGVTGTTAAEGHANCAADGAVGCITTASYKAADTAQALAANIVSGLTIAGTTGSAPSSCGSDGQQNCTVSGVFKAANVTGISTWDVRIGKSLGGITGALKTNCRNTVNNTYFNWDGAIGSLPNTASTSGTTNDIWDTVDDRFSFSTAVVSGWSASTLCDSSTWTDVTTTDGGSTTTTCALSSANCQYRDNITNLVVTKAISLSSTWTASVQGCNSSTYGGFIAGTWRLPTEKELLSLYQHGIVSLASANFITQANLQTWFWSSSTQATTTNYAWNMYLVDTSNSTGPKTNTNSYLCVR